VGTPTGAEAVGGVPTAHMKQVMRQFEMHPCKGSFYYRLFLFLKKFTAMSNHSETKENNSLYYILAVICGILTAWVITQSVLFCILGAILGLLSAGFYANVLAKGNDDNGM